MSLAGEEEKNLEERRDAALFFLLLPYQKGGGELGEKEGERGEKEIVATIGVAQFISPSTTERKKMGA